MEEEVDEATNTRRYKQTDPTRAREKTDHCKVYLEAIENLKNGHAKIVKNKREETKRDCTSYQHVQSIALLRYFEMLIDGVGKMDASTKVAHIMFQKCGKFSYMARNIRIWGDQYLANGKITDSNQGKHMGLLHILTSPEVQQQLITYLRKVPVLNR